MSVQHGVEKKKWNVGFGAKTQNLHNIKWPLRVIYILTGRQASVVILLLDGRT